MPNRNDTALVWTLNPTANPTAAISAATKMLRARSATVRPESTADRAIGSDRNRSNSPLLRSVARPTAVPIAPNTVVWTKIPGIKKST